MRALRHLLAIVVLPGTVCVLIPALLLHDADLAPWPLALVGAALLAGGVGMIAWTVSLFVRRRARHAGALGPDRRGSSSAGPTGTCATR